MIERSWSSDIDASGELAFAISSSSRSRQSSARSLSVDTACQLPASAASSAACSSWTRDARRYSLRLTSGDEAGEVERFEVFEGGFEGAAGHRAGAVDDQGEVERGAGSGDDVSRLAGGDDADEDMRRFGGGAEEALLQGQDFDLGLAHGWIHHHHHAPIPYTVNIE